MLIYEPIIAINVKHAINLICSCTKDDPDQLEYNNKEF